DGGLSFEPLNDGLYGDVHTIAVDPCNSRRLYATTGAGFYISENAGGSWRSMRDAINRSYTVPLFVTDGEADVIFTAAAAGPPPTWGMGHAGADAALFRSDNHGKSFDAIPSLHVWGRGMVMRLRGDPESGGFFGVTNDGHLIRSVDRGAGVSA